MLGNQNREHARTWPQPFRTPEFHNQNFLNLEGRNHKGILTMDGAREEHDQKQLAANA